MKKQKQIFVLSKDGLTFKKQSFFKTRISLLTFILTTSIIVFGLFVNNKFNYFDTSFLGVISYQTENQLLKSELKNTNDKINLFLSQIDDLSASDNEMRKIVNLPSAENKNLGFGGKVETKTDILISKDASDVLKSSRKLIEELESKINFQKVSYIEIYNKSESNKLFFSSLPAIRPMMGHYAIHGGYGIRLHPILGIRRMHDGIDIMNDIGTPVYATGDATVIESGHSGTGYGIVIELNHGFGYTSIYAHLSRVLVSHNQKVKRGQLIGYSGNTGLSSGPHLHYEVKLNNKNINPKTYFIDGVSFNSPK